ncbi:MAG: dTMP kinase [Proteobacteria bacterium]|nr:dTMP kinase [Pseudomonadota bacterium]
MADTSQTLRGKFITFEGTEGTGKTTQIQCLEEYLHSRGLNVLVTREPGGTRAGEQVRTVLLEQTEVPLDARTELLLMFAARAQHLAEIIYPALRDGAWVLCDRFTDASYAYQGGGRGISDSDIKEIESVVHLGFQPDLTIVLTCALETAMQRVSSRGKKDRFERESQDFFERVHAAYLKLAGRDPERFAVIDTEPEIEEVASRIRQTVDSRFSL